MMVAPSKPPPLSQPVPTGAIELMPGDVAAGQAGDQFKTLLGSCISVILTDPRRTVAAMCHIVHVGRTNESNAKNTAYGTAAMAEMFRRLRAMGCNPSMCEAYVFGGGNMFPQFFNGKHIGATNADWVLDYLHEHDIAVVDHCLGGNGYRKVSWIVGTGEPVVETVFAELGTGNDR